MNLETSAPEPREPSEALLGFGSSTELHRFFALEGELVL